jgi:hypothetical protein
VNPDEKRWRSTLAITGSEVANPTANVFGARRHVGDTKHRGAALARVIVDQGGDPDQAMSYVKFVRHDPLFAAAFAICFSNVEMN